ncbi:unnamed protein product [Rhizophagus irregularis]|nr:unnamed protein product [Rhizophagus irregularis]
MLIPKYFGVLPYVDPKMLDKKIPYNLSKKSDIYKILNGVREEPIPTQMLNLLNFINVKCWRYEPDERPDVNQVISKLNEMGSENNFYSKKNENEEIKITEELKSEEIKDEFSDCHLSNYD